MKPTAQKIHDLLIKHSGRKDLDFPTATRMFMEMIGFLASEIDRLQDELNGKGKR